MFLSTVFVVFSKKLYGSEMYNLGNGFGLYFFEKSDVSNGRNLYIVISFFVHTCKQKYS